MNNNDGYSIAVIIGIIATVFIVGFTIAQIVSLYGDTIICKLYATCL